MNIDIFAQSLIASNFIGDPVSFEVNGNYFNTVLNKDNKWEVETLTSRLILRSLTPLCVVEVKIF